MFDFHQKRKLRTLFGSRVTQGIVLTLAFLVMYSAYNRYLIAREMADRRIIVESEIQALKERRESLDAEVKYLSNERGIESEMRRQFDVAQEGEQVIILVEEENAEVNVIQDATSSTPERAWYRFW
jgi:cell division protein FtsB